MTPEGFVKALKETCSDAAVKDCLSNIQSPPGRKPDPSLVKLSNWYRGLEPQDQAHVLDVMRETASATLFGVLCVIDGVRAVEDSASKSEFKLTATRDGKESVISPSYEHLHEIFKAEP